MKKIIPIFGYLILIGSAAAQQFPAYQLFININGVPTAVTSTLTSGQIPTPPAFLAKCVNAGVIVDCNFGGGGATGTVTSFSAGALSPLFTTSVATATTTPALTFSLSNAAAHSFFGNGTGSTAAPSYSLIGSNDWSPQSYAVGAGLVNVMTACPSPAVTALVAGLEIDVLPNFANTTTTPTLNLCTLGAKTITKLGTSALAAGDYTTTAVAKFIYDGTVLQLQNPQTTASTGVTAIGVTTANGVSGTSSGGSTPSLTITLGAITPSTVNSMLVTGNSGGGSVFIGFGISTTSAVNGNTCIGSLSCDSIAGGGTTSSITAIGINAYRSNAGGNDNVAIGDTALYNIGTPTFDVAIGSQAGRSNSTSGSVFVGYHAQLTGAANNVNLIGANTSGSTANQTILGNTSITTTIIGGVTNLTSSDGFQSSGTTFTVAGCGTSTSLTGGGTAGSFVGGSATCTPVITTGLTAAHGWACHMNDFTTSTALFRQTATSTTTATFTAGGVVGATDTINFLCMGY